MSLVRRRKRGLFRSLVGCGSGFSDSGSRHREDSVMLRSVVLGGSAPPTMSPLRSQMETERVHPYAVFEDEEDYHNDIRIMDGSSMSPTQDAAEEIEILSELCARGSVEELTECLQKTTTIILNDRNSMGLTPLQTAVYHSNNPTSLLLIDLGSDLTLRYPNDGGTILHMCVRQSNHSLLLSLLRHFETIRILNEETEPETQSEKNSYQQIRKLIEMTDDSNFTVLHEALAKSDFISLQYLLTLSKTNYHHLNGNYHFFFDGNQQCQELPYLNFCLTLDSGSSSLILTKYLLLNGIDMDVNVTDPKGWSALMVLAATRLKVTRKVRELAILILDAGALVDRPPPGSPQDSRETVLHICAAAGNDDLLNLILARNRYVNLDSRNAKGSSPLHVAVAHARFDIMRTLILAGADCNARDQNKMTAWECVRDTVTYPSILHVLNVSVRERDEAAMRNCSALTFGSSSTSSLLFRGNVTGGGGGVSRERRGGGLAGLGLMSSMSRSFGFGVGGGSHNSHSRVISSGGGVNTFGMVGLPELSPDSLFSVLS